MLRTQLRGLCTASRPTHCRDRRRTVLLDALSPVYDELSEKYRASPPACEAHTAFRPEWDWDHFRQQFIDGAHGRRPWILIQPKGTRIPVTNANDDAKSVRAAEPATLAERLGIRR